MSYTLQTSGIATSLQMCLAVDQDGTTIKEFVSSAVNSTMTIDAGVTTGSSTWNSVSRGFFQTTTSAGIAFGANKPTFDAGAGHIFSVFWCAAGVDNPSGSSGYEALMFSPSPFPIFSFDQSSFLQTDSLGTHQSTTALTTNLATKCCGGYWHNFNTASPNGFQFYFANGVSIATDGNGADGGFGNDGIQVDRCFFESGLGSAPGKYHILAVFQGQLASGDWTNLGNNWFGTLFQAAAPPPVELLGGKVFVMP